MIDWWALAGSALWVIGLAIGLAALSVADFQAHRDGVRLREALGRAGFRAGALGGLVLVCFGLLLGGRTGWEQALWALLTALFAGLVARAWWERPADREGRSMLRAYGWGLVAAGLVVLGGWGAFTARDVLAHGRSLQAHLDQLQAVQTSAGSLGPAELKSAGEHLDGMDRDLQAIQARLGPLLPLGRLLSWVPGYGGELAAAPDLFAVAAGAVSAGDRTFQALSPGLALLDEPAVSEPPLLERLVPLLVEAGPELEQAQGELAAVQEARRRIDVASLSPRLAGLVSRLDGMLPWFETGVDAALLAPGLLGADRPRTYLVVAQNNQELRPTGGFISGVGELHVEAGRIAGLEFRDSYAVDNLEVPHDLTPADFQAVLDGQLWFFRDANWDPNFPTSARRMLDIYARDAGVPADGVVALDLTVLQGLVSAVGPVRVGGIDGPVTGANVLRVIQAEWGGPTGDGGSEWWLHRKDFMGEIARAVMDRVLGGEGLEPVPLARTLKTALDEKHLLIYVVDSDAAGLVHDRGWDGATPDATAASDLLQVVDTNVGFNKVDANVERSVRYEVDLSGINSASEPTAQRLRARLTLHYANRSRRPVESCIQEARYGDTYADMMDRCYWNYVRVYAPEGSDLVQAPDLALPSGSLLARQGGKVPADLLNAVAEGGSTSWRAFFALEPGGEQSLVFEYRLPDVIVSRDSEGGLYHYRLKVPKQAGTGAIPLEVEVLLPPGAEVVSTWPVDLPVPEDGALTIATDLRIDRSFEIVFR